MATSIAIRLGVEGGAELKRVLDDAGSAGQAAFQKVGAAADQAAAATDRQTAKWQRLAQAAREAEAQARAQANVNALLGVGAGGAGSARDSASVFEAELARQDQIRAARQEQAARTAQTSINTLLGVRDAQVGAARASASAFEEAYRAETDALRRSAEARTTIVRNTVSGWRDLGAAGAATLANIEAGRRLGSLGNVPEAANQNVARRLRPDEITNLTYQGGDVVAQLGSGSPLSMIALQQGPQIAQVFAGPGGASVKGAFGQAGEAVAGFVSRIGLVGGAIGGVTAAVVAGIAATVSYRNSQQETEKVLAGVGRTSGVTLSQINDLADAQVRAGNFSRRGAREIATVYAGNGRVGPEILGDAVGATRDFSRFLGVDATEGAAQLAASLGDVSKGVDDLGQRYGILNEAQAENIRRLDAQGNRLGAQRALLDAVRASTRGVAEETRGWALVTQTVGTAWDRLGQTLDRFATGGDLQTRIADLRRVLAEGPQQQTGILGLLGVGAQRPAIQAELDRLLERQRLGQEQTERAQAAQRSYQVGAVLRSLSPDQEELKRLTDQGVLLRKAITEPMRFGLRPEQVEEAKRGFGDLSTVVRNLVEDIDRFGSRATAALNRTAEFNARMVGATGFGRSAAEINKTFDDQLRDAKEADRAGIERARQIELSNLTRSQTLEQTQRGGAFARAPADIQQMILAAAQRFPTVTPEILAAIGEKENSFRLSGPTNIKDRFGNPASTAWGFGQITVDAETDIRRLIPGFDRKDPSQAVMGAAAYLSLRQQWAGGDQIKALNGYGTGPGYGIDIMRRAGQMGDASSLGVARDLDAQTQAVERSQDVLRRNTELYGRNGAQLEASTRAAELYQDMLARGVPPSEALRKSLEGFALSAEQASRATRLVQFARDDEFSREQLGRDRIDQQAYAVARARFGDTTSPEARAAISRTRDTLEMSETKAIFSDGVTSFVTDLRRGGDAATALSNAFGNAADRLIAKVMDSAISSAFGAAGGGSGGGIGGFISNLFGGGASAAGASPTGGVRLFDVGGFTGHGERYDVAGLVHRGEVVFSQDDVARHGGVAAVEILRRSGGLRGYADGGYVGRDAFTMPSAAAMRPANGNGVPPINFITPPGVALERDGPPQRRADGGYDQAIRVVEGGLGQRMARGQGPFRGVSGAGYRNG
ncbi:phage tail length tape measure family protein [Methylorubrum sp. B1-46]|uniref:phage tail length tape measure family protein n=1 Tax=Methylorubrum sp. B1-46 TaxID=2897334 RepID=UPI001E45600A|nr:phage tail length tape measure family protein [Methylorubrum sp. B1-46]UGB26352.1 phage tail length tape measure family protein [Methylorubrum sp. B1-46]